MNGATIQAKVTLPYDCLAVVSALIEKLGGRVQVENKEEETIIVPPMADNERPGKMLKGLRLREELTQAQLAKAIGVPQSHISAYEKNARPIPKEKAAKLAEVLHSVPENFC